MIWIWSKLLRCPLMHSRMLPIYGVPRTSKIPSLLRLSRFACYHFFSLTWAPSSYSFTFIDGFESCAHNRQRLHYFSLLDRKLHSIQRWLADVLLRIRTALRGTLSCRYTWFDALPLTKQQTPTCAVNTNEDGTLSYHRLCLPLTSQLKRLLRMHCVRGNSHRSASRRSSTLARTERPGACRAFPGSWLRGKN